MARGSYEAGQDDGQVRWKYEFVKCGVMVSPGQGVAATKLVAEILGGQTNVRDLYGRLGYGDLAGQLGNEKNR